MRCTSLWNVQHFVMACLHIIMQTAKMGVPFFFLSGISINLIRFENSIYDPFIQEHVQLLWCAWYWRRVLIFPSFQLPFLLAGDTVMASSVDLHSLDLSKLGLTN